MASDEIVWQIINQQFCSYKLKAPAQNHQTFCRNPHNVTGLCTRQSCPLANSRYATVRSDPATGVLYLYTKVPERAHLPSRLWERQRLPTDYGKALALLDGELAYWPKFLVHKCKQRLTRLTRVALRMRKLAREEARLGEKVVPRLAPKVRKREETRERKAERAAKVERQIERELVERLRSGAYGDRPLNVQEGVWRKVMAAMEREGDGIRDVDLDDGIEEEEEDGEKEVEEEGEEGFEYVSDLEESDDEEGLGEMEDWLGGESPDEEDDDDDDEDESADSEEDDDEDDEDDDEATRKALEKLKRKRPAPKQPPAKPVKKAKGPKANIEYELEHELPARQLVS